jgi:hypothetical protein
LRQASLSLFLAGIWFQPPGVGSILPNSASDFLLGTFLGPEISGTSAQKFILGLGCLVPAPMLLGAATAKMEEKGVALGRERDQFPVGMRVLAVDDDPVCLKVLETLLRRCQYHG